ncbi:uncharacterized protein LY79DRAFT_697908 [Colletotrichum navitas]|uniref:AAA+ ATPase domain-containing protein n=1 Tax=Colletotrichum navitas TaxID=681940 RepID=A0AAD8PN47_9PEZI|nr:uncharacterized protein LY79DRAFT_697908 [Colletotrichum navitas]KAK1573235.1 hypothetical protein LY79DRAFT_697908 [Colletotrichum navitas]
MVEKPTPDTDGVFSKTKPQADVVVQLKHLALEPQTQRNDEVLSSPLLTVPLIDRSPPSQFGLFGASISGGVTSLAATRLFHNVACPSSVFICGSQGSGKSNTLACLLENCLIPSQLGQLPHPLTGIVFHYDSFISDSGGLPCEAAFIASHEQASVRVLCAPTNVRTIRKIYSGIPNVTIKPLKLSDDDLNTRRMNDLMAVGEGGSMPLYLHVVNRILRDMRMKQQRTGLGFSYAEFRRCLSLEDLTPGQLNPLNQRLDTLESFMVKETAAFADEPIDWQPKSGQLTVVDLSCPCVTAELACSLFNICLSLFLEQQSPIGRVVALDEAHKYMKESEDSQALTNALLETIRLQRHRGVRVLISTQEPTVSTKLLDLCSVTVVHRFTSPDWLRTLGKHLAGISSMSVTVTDEKDEIQAVSPVPIGGKDPMMEIFSMIVSLHTGQALVFAPSAVLALHEKGVNEPAVLQRLAHRALRVMVRSRLTRDGGRTVMAIGDSTT